MPQLPALQRPGLLSRLRSWTGLGPWTSRPGPWAGGPAGYTDDGWIPFEWGLNHGQRGFDPITGGGNSVAYACVTLYCRTIAQLPGMHRRALANGGTETITTSALSRVLKKPNEYQTRSDLMFNAVASLLFEGNAYALALRNDRFEIDSLHLLNPRTTKAYVVPETGEVWYSLGSNDVVDPLLDPLWKSGERLVVPMRDMLHIRVFCPRNPLVGESPLKAAALSMATHTAGAAQMARFYENMSRPSGVLSTDLTLTAQQVTELRARWNEQSKGINAGGVPILTAGLKWQGLSMSAVDAQMVENLKLSVADVSRVFGVPLALVNDMTGATWNNTEQLMSAWLRQGLGFYLEHIELSFDKLFGIERATDYSEFDVNALLRPDFKTRTEGLARAVQGGIYSPNEARREEGLPEVEGGDEPRVQQQVVPLTWVEQPPAPPAPPAAPPAPANDDEDTDEVEPQAAARALGREDVRARMMAAVERGVT